MPATQSSKAFGGTYVRFKGLGDTFGSEIVATDLAVTWEQEGQLRRKEGDMPVLNHHHPELIWNRYFLSQIRRPKNSAIMP